MLEDFRELRHRVPRKQFDALLANALQDPACPLSLISTVRADFLDRFEQLPRLLLRLTRINTEGRHTRQRITSG